MIKSTIIVSYQDYVKYDYLEWNFIYKKITGSHSKKRLSVTPDRNAGKGYAFLFDNEGELHKVQLK